MNDENGMDFFFSYLMTLLSFLPFSPLSRWLNMNPGLNGTIPEGIGKLINLQELYDPLSTVDIV